MDTETLLSTLDTEIPEWIEGEDLAVCDLQDIAQGGCASGAYMPAVTYHTANETMAKHGDSVLEYLEEQHGEIPTPPSDSSWSGIAVFYLSAAVETWAHSILSSLEIDI